MKKTIMKKIGWIQIFSSGSGGESYVKLARKSLESDFDIDLIKINPGFFKRGYLKIPRLLFNLLKLKGEKDMWIRPVNALVTFSFDRTKGKNVALIHHIDYSASPLVIKPVEFLLEKIVYFNLRKVDAIVTVSQYWQDYFLKKGYQDVYKIYNPFNIEDFNITEGEISKFKNKYSLKEKPIIYLGNCQKGKGVVENYQALKEIDAYLVTSGKKRVDIPAINLDLNYREYLCLLKASSVVLTMSKFKEGWCRTAHEAMLSKTSVIGSGLGGMRELLEGGRQVVCENPQNLREKVEYLLNHPEIRKKSGEDGYNFAKNFTSEKFKKDWLNLVNKII